MKKTLQLVDFGGEKREGPEFIVENEQEEEIVYAVCQQVVDFCKAECALREYDESGELQGVAILSHELNEGLRQVEDE